MDNLTHSLVGLTAAKTGLERLSPGATLLCVLAANSPDSDVVVGIFGDRWDLLQHHRGITHSLFGTVLLALLAPLIFYGADRLWARLRHHTPKTNFRGLLIASCIVTATHPVLDWTNNYGIRLLLPWNSRWFYGDLVFIVDPFIWLLLIAGLLVIWRVPHKSKAKIAFASFALLLAYWGLLGFAHASALARGRDEAERLAVSNGETILRLAIMPTLANPLRWDCVFATDKATYRFRVALNGLTPDGRVVRYEQPSEPVAMALTRISGQKSARVFLEFARFPVMRLGDGGCTPHTVLQLADLRYTEPGNSRGTFAVELPVDCYDPAVTEGR